MYIVRRFIRRKVYPGAMEFHIWHFCKFEFSLIKTKSQNQLDGMRIALSIENQIVQSDDIMETTAKF